MNPKLILTIEHGCLIAAVASGTIDVVVVDNDIPPTHRLHVGTFQPDVITIAEMTARIKKLNALDCGDTSPLSHGETCLPGQSAVMPAHSKSPIS